MSCALQTLLLRACFLTGNRRSCFVIFRLCSLSTLSFIACHSFSLLFSYSTTASCFYSPIQHERSYQKQVGVNINKNVNLKIKGDKKKARFYKDIGLGFKTPKEAIEGTYIDKKCPFTSTVSIRGRILKGIVRSTKMRRTIVIRRDYLHFIPKMSRYEKRHVTLAAHASPAFRVNEGDAVIVGECRPLSKTVSFNLVKIEKAGPSQDSLKSFAGF